MVRLLHCQSSLVVLANNIHNLHLIISYVVPPQIMPFSFGDEASNAGDLVVVQCAAIKGDLPIRITWAFNGEKLTSGRGVEIAHGNKRISSLTIDAVNAHHVGEYTCRAQNSAAYVNHTATLKVNGNQLSIKHPSLCFSPTPYHALFH